MQVRNNLVSYVYFGSSTYMGAGASLLVYYIGASWRFLFTGVACLGTLLRGLLYPCLGFVYVEDDIWLVVEGNLGYVEIWMMWSGDRKRH